MDALKMTNKADLKVYFDADTRMYNPAWMAMVGMSEEKFIAFFRDCPSVGFERNGIPFGGAILHGNEVHFAVMPEFHGKWGTLLRSAFAWLFSQKDPLYAKVHRPNRICLRTVRRLGGKLVRSDKHFLTFELTSDRLPAAMKVSQEICFT